MEKTYLSNEKLVSTVWIPSLRSVDWDFKSGFLGIFETTEIREEACVHVLLTDESFHGINWSLKET